MAGRTGRAGAECRRQEPNRFQGCEQVAHGQSAGKSNAWDGAAKPATRSSATRQHLTGKSASGRQPFFSWRPMRTLWCASDEMESAMRRIWGRVPGCDGRDAGGRAGAGRHWVPPFKGNDTGGIIAYSLAIQADARQLAVDHCAALRQGGEIPGACRPTMAATSRSPAAGCPMAPPNGRCARSTERGRIFNCAIITLREREHDATASFIWFGASACWRCCRSADAGARGTAGAQGGPVGNEGAAHRIAVARNDDAALHRRDHRQGR